MFAIPCVNKTSTSQRVGYR